MATFEVTPKDPVELLKYRKYLKKIYKLKTEEEIDAAIVAEEEEFHEMDIRVRKKLVADYLKQSEVILAETDVPFFLRYPKRRFRLRMAAPCEVDLAYWRDGITVPDGWRVFAVVAVFREKKCIQRIFVDAPADSETDLSDNLAEQAWNVAKCRQDRLHRGLDYVVQSRPSFKVR